MSMRFMRSPLFFILLAAVAGLVSFGAARATYQEYRLRQEIASLEADIGALREKRLDSLNLLAHVLSPAFVEEKARMELNMRRPNERVAVVDVGGREPESAAGEEDAGQPMKNPLKWWYYFIEADHSVIIHL